MKYDEIRNALLNGTDPVAPVDRARQLMDVLSPHSWEAISQAITAKTPSKALALQMALAKCLQFEAAPEQQNVRKAMGLQPFNLADELTT